MSVSGRRTQHQQWKLHGLMEGKPSPSILKHQPCYLLMHQDLSQCHRNIHLHTELYKWPFSTEQYGLIQYNTVCIYFHCQGFQNSKPYHTTFSAPFPKLDPLLNAVSFQTIITHTLNKIRE